MVEEDKAPAQVLSDSYTALQQAIMDRDHQLVNDNTKSIVKLGDPDKIKAAVHSHIVGLIKLRRLDDALNYINGSKQRKEEFILEAAYI